TRPGAALPVFAPDCFSLKTFSVPPPLRLRSERPASGHLWRHGHSRRSLLRPLRPFSGSRHHHVAQLVPIDGQLLRRYFHSPPPPRKGGSRKPKTTPHRLNGENVAECPPGRPREGGAAPVQAKSVIELTCRCQHAHTRRSSSIL